MRPIILFWICTFGLLAADDAFVGVWKVNFAKSTSTGPVASVKPKSAIIRYEAIDGGMKITNEVIAADGSKQAPAEHVVKYDGKPYPLKPDSPPGDVVINRRIDLFTEETVYQRNGKVRATTTRVVSPDGKVMTSTSRGAGHDGKEVVTVTVFDKQ